MTDSSVAIIPARGGSKRIPRKNIRLLSGRPLLAWAVDACLASEAFDSVVVSTDDDEIAAVALSAGAQVPFLRPAALADDYTSTVDVIGLAVEELIAGGTTASAACCVYPASVFLEPEDFISARQLLAAAPYVATITGYPHPVQRALVRDRDGTLSFAHPEYADVRTQDLEPRWHDAGQFYWGTTVAWRQRLPILANAAGYVVNAAAVCDIDTEADWRRAEQLHAAKLRLR